MSTSNRSFSAFSALVTERNGLVLVLVSKQGFWKLAVVTFIHFVVQAHFCLDLSITRAFFPLFMPSLDYLSSAKLQLSAVKQKFIIVGVNFISLVLVP